MLMNILFIVLITRQVQVSETQESGEHENAIIAGTKPDNGNSAAVPTRITSEEDQTEKCYDSTDATAIASIKDLTAYNDTHKEAGGVFTFAGPVHAKGTVSVCADFGTKPTASKTASSEPISSDHPDTAPENPITSEEDNSSETPAVFAGPVHGKGTMTVAAHFGCGPPAINPAYSNIGAAMFPPVFIPNFFPLPSSAHGNTQHSSATNRHFLSTFSPRKNVQLLECAKSLLRYSVEPSHSNESRRNSSLDAEECLPIDTALVNLEEEFKVPDTKLANSREDSEKLAFFGHVPASGSVNIAARF